MKHIGKIFIVLAIVLVFSVTIVQADVLPPGGGSGAIFTTTPDGSIVNENVHYTGRHYVYLDGGPKQNAPPQAAGLDEGFYVFQITDPPGKILLSRDPARCRIVHVNEFGVIDQLMAPTDAIVEDPDGNTVVDYTGAISDNWQDPGNGNRPYADEPCHVPGPDPDSAPGTYAPTPDITGVGRHDTNPDVDHNDVGAIVAQMMPYGLTPNPGGVYKAWMTPIQAYTSVKQAGLNEVPSQLPKGKQKPHECFDFCADADPGFEPSHRYTKTDNFKVTEKFPAEIKVRKFDDLDGDGVWDENEPEIGVDECVDANGDFIDCPGGWPYDFTEPLDGGTKTDTFYTPHTHVAGIAGTYTAEEYHLTGWTQTAAYLDGDFVYDGSDPAKAVSVNVLATAPGETHEIIFGNFKNVDVEACKYEDKTGDGLTADDTPISGWTVYLTKNGAVQDTQTTGANGCYKWTDLGPVPGGYYDVSEDTPTGWTPTSATSHNFESPPMSGASYTFTFTNFKNVDVEACKLKDADGSLLTTDDQTPIQGWTVHLTKNGAVQDTQTTGANGCYKWTDLGPVAGGYYDVSEEVPDGWIPLTPTFKAFESPPRSGASYSFTFINTPTQGCTPGFWQGGPDKPDSKAGGALLWDGFATVPPEDDPNYPGNPQPPPYVDPQWVASGGYDGNPYIHTTPFSTFFTEYDIPNDGTTSDYTMFELVNTGGGSENWRKLARDVVAAYLNSSWGMAYAYTPGEIEAIWDDAVEKDTFLYWHTKLDAANNGPGGCPISASGW